jgi:HEAT repeat protein
MRSYLLLLAATAAFAQAPAQTDVDRAYDLLTQATQDGNPAKRIESVLAMGVVRPDAKAVALVESLLNDKDFGTRQAACSALGEMKSKASIPKLQDALEDKAPEVVFAAARALYAMGDPGGRAVLSAILIGDRPDSSGLVTSSLRDARLKLHDPKALLLLGVNQSAGLLGPFGVSVPIAEMLMKDKEASAKTAAILLLSTDTAESSKQAVRSALSDKNWTVRVAAARAVATRDILPFYSDVLPMLDDKREEVRLAAAATIIRLKQPLPKPVKPRPQQSRTPGPKAQD